MAVTLENMATQLRAIALGHPETYEERPWGDRVVKVRGKIFFSCNVRDGQLYLTAKLPRSRRALLERPYAEPTHYGMGKHGWVTCKFAGTNAVPVDEVRAWIAESFAAVAPKKLQKPSAVSHRPSARKKPAKAKAKALLVCGDELRAQRAVEALGARGVAVDVVERAAGLELGKARAVIVDLGRNPVAGLALAEQIDASDAAVHLFVAGVRDADQTRKLRALGSAESFRAAPGDPAVADAVARTITGGARRAP